MFIGIEVKNPRVAKFDGGVRVVALLGEVGERVRENPGTRRAGDFHGPVGGTRVENHDVVGAVHRGEARRKVKFLIEREDEDGDGN